MLAEVKLSQDCHSRGSESYYVPLNVNIRFNDLISETFQKEKHCSALQVKERRLLVISSFDLKQIS